MNKDRRSEIQRLSGELNDIGACLEDLRDEEQDYYDSMPENFQQGEKGGVAQDAILALEDAINHVNDAINSLDEAIG